MPRESHRHPTQSHPGAARVLDSDRRITIETPEHVTIEMELAGFGSRAIAALIDMVLVAALFILAFAGIGLASDLGATSSLWLAAVLIILAFLTPWAYFTGFEGLTSGRTPGKQYVGIRVITDSGQPITFAEAALRNLLKLIDMQPVGTFFVGLLFVMFHRQGKRLGDIVAGTIVVRDRVIESVVREPTLEATGEELLAGEPRLSDDEYRFLEQLVRRLDSLDAARRLPLMRKFAARLADRIPLRDENLSTGLVAVLDEERRIRQSRFTARRDRTSGRTVVMADRFVASRRDAWEAFRRQAASVERRGIGSLPGSEVLAFTARYREIAADLARARTYGVSPRDLQFLDRVVSAGHSALYRGQHRRRMPVRHLLLRELPATLYDCRAYVLAAFLAFIVPGVVGFIMLRQQPSLAFEILPDVMVDRAEAGVGLEAEGVGYEETPSMFLPVVASSIIANNVQVAFTAFAFGITAGIGTIVVLAFNGLFFGATLGQFANYGLADWLLTFVAGHGVLELFAIYVAGGAGLLLGRAIIAPGDLRRRDSLVLHGRRAIRLVGVAVLLLLLAGTIEGLLSASGDPAAIKLGVSVASGGLLVLVFAAGRAEVQRRAAGAQAGGPEEDFGSELSPPVIQL